MHLQLQKHLADKDQEITDLKRLLQERETRETPVKETQAGGDIGDVTRLKEELEDALHQVFKASQRLNLIVNFLQNQMLKRKIAVLEPEPEEDTRGIYHCSADLAATKEMSARAEKLLEELENVNQAAESSHNPQDIAAAQARAKEIQKELRQISFDRENKERNIASRAKHVSNSSPAILILGTALIRCVGTGVLALLKIWQATAMAEATDTFSQRVNRRYTSQYALCTGITLLCRISDRMKRNCQLMFYTETWN